VRDARRAIVYPEKEKHKSAHQSENRYDPIIDTTEASPLMNALGRGAVNNSAQREMIRGPSSAHEISYRITITRRDRGFPRHTRA